MRQRTDFGFACKALLLGLVLQCAGVADGLAQDAPDTAVTAVPDTIQPFILDSIVIVRNNVMKEVEPYKWARELTNDLHTVTREEVIRYEMFVEPGDTITQHTLNELENRLRELGTFTAVDFEVLPATPQNSKTFRHAALKITTRDAWSTRALGTYSSSKGLLAYGVTLKEANLLGWGKQISVGADYTTVNDRGWRGTFSYTDPNLYGSHLQLGGLLRLSRQESSGYAFLGKPFYADRVKNAFNGEVAWFDGTEYYYVPVNGEGSQFASFSYPSQRVAASGWVSFSNGKSDVFRSSLAIRANSVASDSVIPFNRAFDNSISVFGGISSLRRRFVHVPYVEFSKEVLVPVGAQGSVSIGKISPHSGGRDNVVYVGGEASQAIIRGSFYGFASVEAGTGLAGKESQFTLQRTTGSAMLNYNPSFIVARIQQSTVWNWPRHIFLPLDNTISLRGYPLFSFLGDNRIIGNAEYRLFPAFGVFGLFDVGFVAFYDIGAVWQQSQKLSQTRFHSSAGAGIRIGSTRGFGAGAFRVDYAYNFDTGKLGQIVLSTERSFDVFNTLEYRPPGAYRP